MASSDGDTCRRGTSSDWKTKPPAYHLVTLPRESRA
jgi:hypothetical protein